MPIRNIGYAAPDVGKDFQLHQYTIRDLRADDVLIDVHYCGICATDLSFRNFAFLGARFPLVAGHEVAGVVAQVGSKVSQFKPGDRVGVGCYVHCCGLCDNCKERKEQFCPQVVRTYGHTMPDGELTFGGYGKQLVCEEKFVLKIPDEIPLESAAPMLCAGISTYSPAKKLNWQKGGMNIGVVGLGGLGHMAVQWAKAMNNTVTLISRNKDKAQEATKLGVDNFLVSSDEEALKAAASTLHHIIDTTGKPAVINKLLPLVRPDGVVILVTGDLHSGTTTLGVNSLDLIIGARGMMGTNVGTLDDHREMLEFAAKHNIRPIIELIKAEEINANLPRLEKGAVKFRLVIDTRASKFI